MLARICSWLVVGGLLVSCAAEPAALGHRYDADEGEESYGVETMVEQWELENEFYVSPVIAATDGASRVAMFLELVDTDQNIALEARGVNQDGTFGPWASIETSWSEQNFRVGFKDIEWHYGAQLRVPVTQTEIIKGLTWSATVPVTSEEEPGNKSLDIGSTSDALRSELQSLGVITRDQWGARRTRCSSRDSRRYRMTIHHTSSGSGGDSPSRMRGFQRYHMDSRGWCDIGYHFLVDLDGRIYEGRPLDLRGAHVGRHNTGNIGISLIGCFEPRNCPTRSYGRNSPTDAMIQSAGRLVATLSQLYGITRNTTNVKGHKQWSGASTDCPGINVLNRFSEILSGRAGGGSPTPTPTPTPVPSGGSCQHSLGGAYANMACSAGYQCCNGSWRTRAGGCGTCACVETSGRTGCSGSTPTPEPTPEPTPTPTPAPSGASCNHSFGGTYADTACSTSYQCCDGRWRTRGSCGACFCVEETGQQGCASGTPTLPTPNPVRSINAGLTQSGSEIPRSGLSNSTGGVGTERYGSVVTDPSGERWVRGTISHFGGPNDTGVTSTETGALTGERLRSLNNPLNASRSTIQSRPEDFYFVAMRWSYSPNGKSWWRNARVVIRNPDNGKLVVVRPVDWGPNTRTRRIVDVSPQTERDLGTSTDRSVDVAFAPPGTPLGPVN